MAFTPATPIAVMLPPSNLPLRFTELINFRGDFDQVVAPGEPVNPKGIEYHPGLDRLLVSLSPYRTASGTRSQILNAVTLSGDRALFAPGYQMFRDVESKIAIAPESGPPVSAGFTPGEIFLNADRAIDSLILALFFVSAVGLGPFPGTLAVAIHSVGMLGKLFADAIEAIDAGPVEAVTLMPAGP